MNSQKDRWKFSEIPSIEESGFNKSLEGFVELGIYGLVRENAQNSYDAKLLDSDESVILKIETGKISRKDIPGVEELIRRIESLEGRSYYTKETIEHMKTKMYEEEVAYISFEDCNTKGLTGAKNGQSDSKEDTFNIYAYNKGVHSEEGNAEKEKVRGGSHGIGKIANNAASDLNIMFFSNCDEEGNMHTGGTVQLIEHKYNNKYCRSTGYFTDYRDGKFYPYENNFGGIFQKDTRGLKIVIPFLREQFNDEKEIIKSVCSNFFISILKNELKVIVNDKIIDSETIEGYIKDEEYYKQEFKDIKDDFTPLYLNTYKEVESRKIKIKAIDDEYEFNLYFKYDTKIKRGRMAVIRTIGMKIEDRKIRGNATKPFNAILMPSSSKEDKFLKDLENESHTEISSEHIKDLDLQKKAKKFIRSIDNELIKIIDEEIKRNNPTDGIIDTGDILYLFESKFKEEISNNVSTVKINEGNGKPREIVKTSGNGDILGNMDEWGSPEDTEGALEGNAAGTIEAIEIPDNTKGKTGSKKGVRKNNGSTVEVLWPGGNPEGNPGGEIKKRKVKQVKKKKTSLADTDKETRYATYTDIVERIVTENKEYIRFDFTETEELKKKKKCDVIFVIIDGMGDEYGDEFKVNESYNYAIDESTEKKCVLEKNKIIDLEIKNGVASLELEISEKFNRALKFVYYVEV